MELLLGARHFFLSLLIDTGDKLDKFVINYGGKTIILALFVPIVVLLLRLSQIWER